MTVHVDRSGCEAAYRTTIRTAGGWRTRRLWHRVFLAYAPVVVLVALYQLSAVLLLDDPKAQLSLRLVKIFGNIRFVLPVLILACVIYGYARLLRRTDASMLVRIGRWLRETPFLEVALLRFLPVMVVIAPMQAVYMAYKRYIPEFVPYGWDGLLIALDRVLFLGADPWTVTHALFPWATATWAMSTAYTIWLHITAIALGAAAVMRLDNPLRLAFLVAYCISWIIGGTLLAMVFSSAGPVYAERLFADPSFAPLMQRLYEQNELWSITALETQEILWKGYVDPSYPAAGISAFPSLHLCTSTVIALFAFGIARPLGWAMAAFTAVMLVSSVHLGWHYASDGVAGMALGVVFWRLSCRFSGWWFDRDRDRATAVPRPAAG